MYRRALLKLEGAEKCHKAGAVPRSAQGSFLKAPGLWAHSGTGPPLREELGERKGRPSPSNYTSEVCHPLQRVRSGKLHLASPPLALPHVLRRHRHSSPAERQPRPSQLGCQPTDGEPGAGTQPLGVSGGGDTAEAPADRKQQRRRRSPLPVAARPAGAPAQGEVRATWQDDRSGSSSLAGASTTPTGAKADGSPWRPERRK